LILYWIMPEGFDERDGRTARLNDEQVEHEASRGEPHRLGRFVILEHLGRGGMGIVYSAYDPVLDRRVALKLLRPQPGRDTERMRTRLHREAQALARLSHPNVVPVYDVGLIDGEVFIVMEFVVGQTLRAWSHERPWHDVLATYMQVARGLAAAHAVGLVHRDVKPDNVVVGQDGRPRVLDFGLVRDVDFDLGAEIAASPGPSLAAGGAEPMGPAPAKAREDLTATNAIMGTPAYMAPEQAASASIGPAVDQFSFCVALYEALYGQLPFAVRDVSERLAELRAARALGVTGAVHVSHPDPIAPPPRSPVPDAFWPILRRGLAREPAERWPSMDALIEALSGHLAAFDQTLAEPGVQRFPQIVFAILGVCVALLVGSAVYLGSSDHEGELISVLAATIMHTALTLVCVALLVYSRARWRRVKQLHRLIGPYALCAAGAVIHDIASLLVGRTLYQTILAIMPMFAVVFAFASLTHARWLAWVAALFALSFVMLLAIPEYFVVWAAGGMGLGWIVVLTAWRRLVKKHGVASASPRGTQTGGASSRLRAT
jgi:serine/threonine protein kinase